MFYRYVHKRSYTWQLSDEVNPISRILIGAPSPHGGIAMCVAPPHNTLVGNVQWRSPRATSSLLESDTHLYTTSMGSFPQVVMFSSLPFTMSRPHGSRGSLWMRHNVVPGRGPLYSIARSAQLAYV